MMNNEYHNVKARSSRSLATEPTENRFNETLTAYKLKNIQGGVDLSLHIFFQLLKWSYIHESYNADGGVQGSRPCY